MPEITVVETTSLLSDITALSSDELTLILKQLSESYINIEEFHFDKLREIILYEVRKKSLTTKPKLIELILRYILQFPHVVCVVRDWPEHKLYKPFVRTKSKKPPLPNSVVLTVDRSVFCIERNKAQTYLAPAGTEIEIVGVVVAHTHHNISQQCKSSVEMFDESYVSDIRSRDLLSTGSYSINRFTSALDAGVSPRPHSINTPKTPQDLQSVISRSYLRNYDNLTTVTFDKSRDQLIHTLFNAIHLLPKYVQSGDTQLHVAYNLSNRNQPISSLGRVIKPIIIKPTNILEVGNLTPLIKRIEQILTIKTATSFTDVIYSDLASVGLIDIWFIALHLGADNKQITEKINDYRVKRARYELIREIEKKRLDDIYLISLYKLIVNEKLGKERYMQFTSKINPNITSVEARKLLTAAEQKILDLEIKRKDNYYNSITTNKCPHVKTLLQFRRARDDRVLGRILEELEKFFQHKGPAGTVGISKRAVNPNSRVSAMGAAQPTNKGSKRKTTDLPSEMVACNNCGFDIICPHVIEITNMKLGREGYRTIRAAIEKYIDKIPTQGNFYCKICGEIVVSKEEFEEADVPRSVDFNEGDEIRKMLYMEFKLIGSYIAFSPVLNVSTFIKTGIETCYAFLFEIEKGMLRIKSNTPAEIKNKLKLFTTILVLAYIVSVIENNKFSSIVQFKGMKPSKEIRDYLTFAVKKVIDMRTVLMNEISGATSDYIKNKVLELYRNFKQIGIAPLTLSDAESLVYVGLYTDPVYWYYHYMLSADRGRRIGWNIPKIMGMDLADLKNKQIYSKVVVPRISTWKTRGFEIGKWHGKTYGAEKTYIAGLEGNTAKAWELFHKYNSERMFNKHLFSSGTLNSDFEKLYTEGRKLIVMESALQSWKSAAAVRPTLLLQAKQNKRFAVSELCLGNMYDENGNRHVWDTFVDTKKGVYGKADIAAAIEKGVAVVIVDTRCSKCEIHKSNACDLDENKIKNALSARTYNQNFFKFYENRCPVGGLHEYIDFTCNKCGWKQTTFPGASQEYPLEKSAMGYLTKYKPNYETELKIIASVEEKIISQKKITREIPNQKFVRDYKYNFNVLLDVSNKLSVDVNLITALGDMFKKDYKEVKTGKYVAKEPTTRWNYRVDIVDSYVKLLITDYNRLKNYYKIHKPSPSHKIMLEKSGISKFDYNKLGNLLPDIYNDYYTKLTSFKRAGKPSHTLNFVIESLCEMLMKIYRDKDNKTKKLREAYVKYMIDRILLNERNITKHERFDWSIFTLRGDKMYSENNYDSNISNTDETINMSGIDLDELDDEERANVTDTSTLFDTSAYDVEDTPYDDDDDEDRGMFKAIGYGMD